MFIGLPIILFFLLVSHFFLTFLETRLSARIFSFLFKGRPPVFYRKWVTLVGTDTDSGGNNAPDRFSALAYGLKRVQLDSVDRIDLTIWGNLILKSSRLQGDIDPEEGSYEPDVVAKLPLGAASLVVLKEFIEALKQANPDLEMNKRLTRKLESKIVKGEELIKTLGAAFLLVVLLDLGYSTSHFLEMQKHYYLTSSILQKSAVLKNADKELAAREFERGEEMFRQRIPVSLVQRALFDHGSAAGGVWQARAEALWNLEKRREAVEALTKAHELYPKSLKLMVELARWKYRIGDLKGSRDVLEQALEEHTEDMLPCLYMIAADKKDAKSKDVIRDKLKKYLDDFDEKVFGEEPWWPPGGNRFMSERFYRADLIFLSETLLNMDLNADLKSQGEN